MIEITFKEDKNYTRTEVEKKLVEKIGLSHQLASGIFDELINFVKSKLLPSLRILLDTLYKDLDVESPLPSYNVSQDTINFGQWVGTYTFESDTLGHTVSIRIEPKVGYKNFEFMLNDALKIVEMVGFPSMEPIFANLKGFGFAYDVVSYSTLLQQYTELALHEGLPLTELEVQEYGEAVVGTPDYTKTFSYFASGVPIAVVTKRVVTPAVLPAVILAKFHIKVFTALRSLIDKLNTQGATIVSPMLLPRLHYHAYVLASEILYPFVAQAESLPIEETELIEEAKRQAKTNWWLKTIIDLYTAFSAKIPALHEFDRKIMHEAPIQPLPTSKVYELWVLKLLIEVLYRGKRPKLTKNRGGFELSFDNRKLVFNVSKKEWSKLVHILATPPKPDYILAGENKMAVVDAKYKNRLDTEDVERMITYIIDYAEPQEEQRNGEIKGFFVMLRSHVPVFPLPAAERINLKPKFRIYIAEANPSNPNQARKTAIMICNKVFLD